MTEINAYQINWEKAVWKKQFEQTGGILHVPSEYFGFIRLFERNRSVSVYVNDIEGLAKVCEEHLNKRLLWKEGSILYFYHLKLVDLEGQQKAVDYDSVVGTELCRLSKLQNHIKSIDWQ